MENLNSSSVADGRLQSVRDFAGLGKATDDGTVICLHSRFGSERLVELRYLDYLVYSIQDGI